MMLQLFKALVLSFRLAVADSDERQHRRDIHHRQSNQLNPNRKTHQQIHNSNRRHKDQIWPEWAPDYPEYDD